MGHSSVLHAALARPTSEPSVCFPLSLACNFFFTLIPETRPKAREGLRTNSSGLGWTGAVTQACLRRAGRCGAALSSMAAQNHRLQLRPERGWSGLDCAAAIQVHTGFQRLRLEKKHLDFILIIFYEDLLWLEIYQWKKLLKH